MTLFSEAFLNDPAKTCPKQGNKSGLQAQEVDCGLKCSGLSANSDPRYVVAENVRGAVNLALDTVYSGLVGEGYKVYPYVIPASAVGAPHQRERLFVVGIREDVYERYEKSMANPGCELRQGGCECGEVERKTREGTTRDAQFSGGALWPSPLASDGSCGGIISPDDTYVQKASGLFRKINRNGTDGSVGLARMVKLWPTPREFMYKDSQTDRGKGNIGEKVGGQLNPDWVGQLMGYPEGWTDLDIDEPKPWAGWPALLGQGQYPFESPRTTTGCKNRAKQLKAYGNSVVPQQVYPFFKAIAEIEKINLREVIP